VPTDTGYCECGPAGWLGSRCTIAPTCDGLTFTAFGTYALHYREVEGYKPFRDEITNELYLAYGRPLYAVALKDTFDVLVYTGSRWFNVIVPQGTFGGLLKAKAPFHAFWDGYSIGEETTLIRYYSDPVGPALPLRGAPVGMEWTYVSSPNARVSFGPYLSSHDGAESNVHWNCKEGCSQKTCGGTVSA